MGLTYCKGQGRKSWVSQSGLLFIFYFISHFIFLSLLYVIERNTSIWFVEWMNENLRNVKKQISDFLHHQKSMYLLWCFQLFIRDPTPPYCWRKEGMKEGRNNTTIHPRLSLHKRKCLSSSWGWHTAKDKEGRVGWVTVFFSYFILLAISCQCLCCMWERERERGEDFHVICWMRNV